MMQVAPELCALSAGELVAGYRAGRFTPVDALVDCLARLDACEPIVNAMVCVDRAGALAAAQESAHRWARGTSLSPLDGVPLVVKDNLHVAGLPTRWGSVATSAVPQAADELPVARARRAGMVLLGKACTPEFALQGHAISPLTGVTRNPTDPSRSPGGSSSGAAAAVAAGYAPLALATDGGGSARRPAAYCGVLGYKPSAGLVGRAGGLPDLFLGREVVGILGRAVSDVRSCAEGIAGAAIQAVSTPPARILFLRALGPRPVERSLADAAFAATQRLARHGHSVVEAPRADWAEDVHGFWPRLSMAGLAWLFANTQRWPGLLREGIEPDGDLSPDTRELLREGIQLGATSLFELGVATTKLEATLATLFARHDLIATPTVSAFAWDAGRRFPESVDGGPGGPRSDAVFTPFVNAAGLCALSVPVPDQLGRTASLQLVAPRGRDDLLFTVARDLGGEACGEDVAV